MKGNLSIVTWPIPTNDPPMVCAHLQKTDQNFTPGNAHSACYTPVKNQAASPLGGGVYQPKAHRLLVCTTMWIEVP